MLPKLSSTRNCKEFLPRGFNSSKISEILPISTTKFKYNSKMILIYDPIKKKVLLGWVFLPNIISVELYVMIWDSERLYKL